MIDEKPLLEFLDFWIKEKHRNCLTDNFDNGQFWALKGIQEFINKMKRDQEIDQFYNSLVIRSDKKNNQT